MHAHRTSRLALALTAVLALTACGETARTLPSSKATPVSVPSVPSTVNPAPTKSPTAAPSGSGTPSASASATGQADPNTVVATASNTFQPASLTVKKGTKVTWTVEGGVHSANSGTPPTVDKSGPIQADTGFQTLAVTFDKPGTYKYFCQPHGGLGMVGEIVVT